MAHNNDALYDAVVAGAGGGAQHGWLVLNTPASYTPFADNIDILATAVDLQIPIIVGGPSISQIELLQSITQSVLTARYPVANAPSTYLDIAKAIAAVYTELEMLLANPSIGGSVSAILPNGVISPFNFVRIRQEATLVGATLDLIPNPVYLTQVTWFLSTAGNDDASGLTSITPIATLAELQRRIGRNIGRIPQDITITFLTDHPGGALDLWFADGCKPDIIGIATTLIADTASLIVPVSDLNNDWVLLTGTAILDFTPYVDRRIRFTSGAGVGKVTFIAIQSPDGIGLQRCEIGTAAGSPVAPNYSSAVSPPPATGATFEIEQLPIVTQLVLYITRSNPPTGITAPAYTIRTLEITNFGTNITPNSQRSHVSWGCLIRNWAGNDITQDNSYLAGCLLRLAQPLTFGLTAIGCIIKSTISLSQNSSLNNCLFESAIFAATGCFVQLTGCGVFRGTFTVGKAATVQINTRLLGRGIIGIGASIDSNSGKIVLPTTYATTVRITGTLGDWRFGIAGAVRSWALGAASSASGRSATYTINGIVQIPVSLPDLPASAVCTAEYVDPQIAVTGILRPIPVLQTSGPTAVCVVVSSDPTDSTSKFCVRWDTNQTGGSVGFTL